MADTGLSETAPPLYDELRDAKGLNRAHWKPLADALSAMPPAEYARRQAAAQAMIRDNGVTYNVYDDADGQARPWQLDILPLAISAADWRLIESAVIQRATLANALLRDIYGPQGLIAAGHLPPHLVLGHPQFLRPLVGITPPHGVHVHLYSADLARAPDGSWRVLSSRADAPSGLGYALENRIVVAQMFPDLFGEMRVQRLASFFNTYRECVTTIASSRKGRAVLLTPGPHNESYFEHAYLAHYLGLTLAEGIDLAVRDGQVFLKTLVGLERVSTIFRRVDSDFCDPLEFRGDSELGIPGLTDAVRAGSVLLANALGGGVIESPAMDAYLPALCRAVLCEDLKIPDTPTVWCGNEWGRKEALSRLDRVIVRDAFDARPLFARTSSARLGSELSAADKKQLIERIELRGATVVTQDISTLGTAPVFESGTLTARPVTIRVFAAWTPHGYAVMPGGLTRMAPDHQARALSMQSGASSKDTWVLGQKAPDDFTLLKQPGQHVEIRRIGETPTSRAMDNLFWLGRYAERAENLVRVLRAVVGRLSDEASIVGTLLEPYLTPAQLAEPPGTESRLLTNLLGLVYERHAMGGLQRLLSRVRRTAWSARDRLSLDTWRTINNFDVGDDSGAHDAARISTDLDNVIRHAAEFSGLCSENMTRGPNWLFVDMGRRIERSLYLTALLRQTIGAEPSTERMRIALEIADSAMTYRSRYLNIFQAPALVDLLLLDDSNPRAVSFQLTALEDHLGELPRKTLGQRHQIALGIVTEMRATIAGAEANRLCEIDDKGGRPRLMELGTALDDALDRTTDAITDAYFQHAIRLRTGADRRSAAP